MNTEMIDQLVSQQALKDLDTLDKQLIASYEEMERTLVMVQKLNVAYDALGKNMKTTSSYMKEATSHMKEAAQFAEAQEKTTQRATKATQKAAEQEAHRKKLIEESIEAERKQIKVEEEHIEITKKAGITTKQLLYDAKKTAEGIDISSYIKKNEDGMVSYSSAINVANQQLGRIEGLQKLLKEEFDQGKISEAEYSSVVAELTQRQTEYGVTLESLQKKYEDAKEAQRQVFNPDSTAFNKLSSDVQEQTFLLVGMNAELNETRNSQKQLEKDYKDGSISLGEYIEKKAQLNATEAELSEKVKELSTDLQLNQQIAKTAEGSYDNLSAKYSLLKIQINAMGEATNATTKEEKENIASKRALEAEAKALYERMNQLQQATGKSQLQVGNYALANKELTGALNTVSPALGGAVSGIQSMTKAAMAFIATPLGLVIAAIAAVLATLSAWFTRTEEGQSALAVGTAAFEKVLSSLLNVATEVGEWLYKAFTQPKQALSELVDFIQDNLMNRLQAIGLMGEAIVKIFSGDLSEGAKDLGNAILQLSTGVEDMIGKTSDWLNETYEGAQRAADIQRKINDLAVKKRELELDESERQAEMNKLRNDANDMEKSLGERLAANNKYMEIANQLGERKKSIAQEELDLRRDQILENKQETEMSIAEKEELNKLAIAVNKTDAEHQQKMFTATRTNNRLRKEGINAQKEAMKERNKELKAMGELESFNYRKSADLQASLFKDAALGYEERKDALLSYIADEKRIIEIKQAEEVKQEGLTETQKKLIKEKALYEIYKLELKQAEELKKLKTKAAEDELKVVKDGISARSEQMNEMMQEDLVNEAKIYEQQIAQNKDNVKKREKITEDYQRRRLEIIRKYNQDAFEFEVEQMQNALDNTELTEDKKLEIHKKIDELRKKNAKELAEFEIKETEDKVDKMLSLEARLNDFLSSQRVQAIMTMWSQSLDIMNMYYDGQLQRIDELEKREQEYWEDKLAFINENVEAGLMSEEEADARKRIIEESQREREKKFEQERKEVQRKQALWEKANSIVQATIATSLGVAKAAPNLVLMGIIGALGAAQIAMIAAQKIPEYARGTDYHKGGLAWVGDGGKSEMVILPSGEVWKTPDRDTLVNLPRGTEVLPDYKAALLSMSAPSGMSYYDDNTGKMIVLNDEVLRNNTRETNSQLASINRGINAIRNNSIHSNQQGFSSGRMYGGKF